MCYIKIKNMSTKPFDFLISEKEPLLFFEKSIIRMDNGELVALNKKDGRFVIQPASLMMIYLGTGTSITQEAAIFAALNDCYISFSRGGAYVHSVWHSGRWSDPVFLVNQCLLHNDVEKRLTIAKNLILKRLNNEFATDIIKEKVINSKSIEELLGYEANWMKGIYRQESEYKNIKFNRDFSKNDLVNERLNLLNNALYSIVTSIILALGLHPSVGFIHGQSRRGGLSFDLADIFKYELTIKPSFNMPDDMEYRDVMYYFNKDLKNNNFKIIKELIQICKKISEGSVDI